MIYGTARHGRRWFIDRSQPGSTPVASRQTAGVSFHVNGDDVRNILFSATGVASLIAGIVLLPTSAPLGLVLILLGLFFLARGSARRRRLIRRLRERFPRLDGFLVRPRGRVLPHGARYLLLRTRPYRRLPNKPPVSASHDSG